MTKQTDILTAKSFYMKYLILSLVTAVSTNTFSQIIKIKVQDKTIELKYSSTNLPVDHFVEIIKNENQNDIAVYSNYLGLDDITEGQFKGGKTGNFKEGIIFKDASKFEFSYKETYLCNIGNNIYTEKIDFLKSLCQVNVYQINNNSLTKLPISISFPFNNTIEKIPQSQYLIFTNTDELFGDEVKIYDKDLNVITTIIPFTDGFNIVRSGFLGNNIIIVSSPSIYSQLKKNFKVTIINTQNNFSIAELIYDDEITPQQLITFENLFVLISEGKLMLLSNQGELLWTKNMNVSTSEFAAVGCESEGKIFIISEGAIVCLRITDGNELWRRQLKDIYPSFEESKSIRNESYMAYVPIDFKVIGSIKTICLLSAKKEQNIKENSMSFSNKNLSMIDFLGNIVKQIPLYSSNKSPIDATNYVQKRVKACQLIIEDYGFRVIGDGVIEKFEK